MQRQLSQQWVVHLKGRVGGREHKAVRPPHVIHMYSSAPRCPAVRGMMAR